MADRTDPSRDVVTLMFVPGRSGQIRRFHFPRVWIRRSVVFGVLVAAAVAALSVDYVRARRELVELDYLRAETREQREQLMQYGEQVRVISEELQRISRFDQKLRVITNLDPGDPLPLPGIGGIEGDLIEPVDLVGMSRDRRHRRMTESFSRLADAAGAEAESLSALIAHLENQTARLQATPSIAPTKGWVTSAFGYRTSPFTGSREFHRGLDIAGRMGTPVHAPADGEVVFAGHRRALGNAVTIRHGYGIETVYGHLKEIHVRKGQRLARGDRLGTLGNSGRSTGPHLHYQVEVNDQPVNPRNYILD